MSTRTQHHCCQCKSTWSVFWALIALCFVWNTAVAVYNKLDAQQVSAVETKADLEIVRVR